MTDTPPSEPPSWPLVDCCPIDIYVPSNMTYKYPYKLGKPETSYGTERIRETCTTHIMDSGIGNDHLSNEDVLDLAHKLDSDFVVAKDYLHDREQTTESIREFLDLYDEHPCRATPMIPLQPPHHVHYQELPDVDNMAFLIGGVKDAADSTVIDALRSFRAQVGYSPYVHLLGKGASVSIANAVATDPRLIQSLDCATPEIAASKGRIFDHELKQRPYPSPTGDGSSTTTTELARMNLWTMNNVYAMRSASPPPAQSTLEVRV